MPYSDSSTDKSSLVDFNHSAESQVPLSEPSSVSADELEGTVKPVEYRVVDGVGKRGSKKLYDNIGYSYGIKRKNLTGTVWQCTHGYGPNRCTVSVRYNDLSGHYERNQQCSHLHPPKPDLMTADMFRTAVIKEGFAQKFDSARDVVETVKSSMFPNDQVSTALSSKSCYERIINRKRQNCRPNQIKSINCAVNENDFPPNFFRGSITLDGALHLMFASDKQLTLLAHAKSLYLDATFKLVRKPFSQLFSIHAFVQNNGNIAQFVLAYIFMSRRTKNDYIAVFNHLSTVLTDNNLHLRAERFVLDFEIGVWHALHEVFTDRYVVIMGCAFHFVQSVWRHIQQAGLQEAYKANTSNIKFFLKKLMALCYLPHAQITNQFENLEKNVRGSALRKVLTYFRNTWIEGSFPPETWSVYGETVRTNNDVEGWHHAFNRRARSKKSLSVHEVIEIMFNEARRVTRDVVLLAEDNTIRRNRKKYDKLQKQIFKNWKSYRNGEIDASKLLDKCALIQNSIAG